VEPVFRGPANQLVDDYERLRNNRLLERSRGSDRDGLVLLMRKGMVEWMRERATAAVSVARDIGASEPDHVSSVWMQSEVTAVLATKRLLCLVQESGKSPRARK